MELFHLKTPYLDCPQCLNISRYESHRYAFEIHQYTQVIHP